MTEASVIEVEQGKLEDLEREHEHLEAVREQEAKVARLESDVEEAADALKQTKKALSRAAEELRAVVRDGPPKPDPQGVLPFATEVASQVAEDDIDDDDDTITEPEDLAIPPAIDDLHLSSPQKQALANAGVETLADAINLGNGNWDKYPKGFESLEGFGKKAAESMLAQLLQANDQEEAPTQRIVLRTFGDGDSDLQMDSEYDAEISDDGVATIKMPGKEPATFSESEYDLVG